MEAPKGSAEQAAFKKSAQFRRTADASVSNRPTEVRRWPKAVTLLFIIGTCGAFWAALGLVFYRYILHR